MHAILFQAGACRREDVFPRQKECNLFAPKGSLPFGAKRWLSAEDFLRYVGLRDGRCAPPELRPLEPNEAYLRFKDCYGIELSRQQERAAQVVDGATLLVAVPGSGKTTVLVARLGYLALERGIAPESIVCITHTKAAAEEMRARFSRRFGRPDVAGRITFCTINKLAKDIYEDSCRRQGAVPRRVDPAAVRGILLDACRRTRSGCVSEDDLVDLESVISRFSASDITPQNRHGHLVFSCLKTIQHAPDKKRATAF